MQQFGCSLMSERAKSLLNKNCFQIQDYVWTEMLVLYSVVVKIDFCHIEIK